jgi:hypothetical protein
MVDAALEESAKKPAKFMSDKGLDTDADNGVDIKAYALLVDASVKPISLKRKR